ncbi:hypothetical protein ACOSQ3_024966 [Xanthoceras sorbifolium]
MEASLKSAFLLTLLLTSGLLLLSTNMPGVDAQPLKDIPCKSDKDCARECEGDTHHCDSNNLCLCVPGYKNCC